jgi:hypothetical protein
MPAILARRGTSRRQAEGQVTVKTLFPVPTPASGFVTVTFRAVLLALLAIVMLTLREVELTNDVEFTVIPPPAKATVAPEAKPVPLMVTVRVELCAPELGEVEVTVGAALTVKTLVPVPVPPSGLVTLTFPAPVVAFAATVMLAISEVELTNVVEFTVIPVAENAAVAPDTNPVPVIVTVWLVAPWPSEAGLVDVTVGAAFTVKTLAPVPTPPSPLVTVTLRAPVAALEAIVMLAVSEVALTNVVEFTVIPVPENATVAPDTNPVPVIVMF